MPSLKRSTLFDVFFSGGYISLPGPHGQWVCGHIEKIEREDGSGWSFNVYFHGGEWAYVRTRPD